MGSVASGGWHSRLTSQRQAILLIGADKGGADQRRSYKRQIQVADERHDEHMSSLSQQSKENHHGKKTR
jgi:hypothetical protein